MDPTQAQRVATAIAAGLVGLMVGSFLNVVIYRVPRALSVVRPRSQCPTCGTTLSATDNVPIVAWLLLRGRCRYCRTPISARYPAIELSCALAFAGIGAGFGPRGALLGTLLVAATTLSAAAIAYDGLAIPRVLDLAGLIGVVALAAVAGADHEWTRLAWGAAGAAVGAGGWLALASSRHAARRVDGAAFALAGFCVGWAWRYGLVAEAVASASAWAGSTVFANTWRRSLSETAAAKRQLSVALGAALGASVVLLVVGAMVSAP